MIEIIVFIVVIVVAIAVVLYLPYSSGLATYLYEKNPKEANKTKRDDTSSNYKGYMPPDEEAALRKQQEEENSVKSRMAALKERAHVTSSDIPLKIRLQSEEAHLRKRNKEKLDIDTDPNKYDYDIDELIDQENRTAIEQQRKEFYKDLQLGKEKEDIV